MTYEQIREKLESLKFYIQDSEASVRTGKMVDLTGLDKNVSQICTRALSLPKAQAGELQPLMAEVIGELERLSIALKDYKDDVRKK